MKRLFSMMFVLFALTFLLPLSAFSGGTSSGVCQFTSHRADYNIWYIKKTPLEARCQGRGRYKCHYFKDDDAHGTLIGKNENIICQHGTPNEIGACLEQAVCKDFEEKSYGD